jgi:hypothetical protein
MITLQMIWTRAWNSFILMNNPPAEENDRCCYRTCDGRACAVGLCLTDQQVSEISQGMSFSHVVALHPEWFADDVNQVDESQLVDFQGGLHDSLVTSDPKPQWRLARIHRMQHYRQIAEFYDLDMSRKCSTATRYTEEQADAIVEKLSFGELDDWAFLATCADDTEETYVVAVYDENGEFVSYYNEV